MASNVLEKLNSSKKNIEYHRPTLSKEELQTVLDCLVDDLMDTGSVVEKFEKDFKSTFSLKNVISVNSLFSAYHLSFLSLGISENDTILLSAYSPMPAFYAALMLKANPYIVDLGKSSFHMDIDTFNRKVEELNPKVVLFDHTFGCLISFSKYDTKNIPSIEDYSEVVGADSESIQIGKQGTIGICGLSSTHVITTGNGALITTSNEAINEFIRNAKYSAAPKKRPTSGIKYDYNMLDFQAAIGIEQISKLGLIIERKKKIAQVYLQAVLSSSHETFFKNAAEDQFNRFPIIVKKSFEEVERYFKSLLIGTERTTQDPLYKFLDLQSADFPNAERLYQRGHCIPIYPNLTKDNVSRIANSIKGLY